MSRRRGLWAVAGAAIAAAVALALLALWSRRPAEPERAVDETDEAGA